MAKHTPLTAGEYTVLRYFHSQHPTVEGLEEFTTTYTSFQWNIRESLFTSAVQSLSKRHLVKVQGDLISMTLAGREEMMRTETDFSHGLQRELLNLIYHKNPSGDVDIPDLIYGAKLDWKPASVLLWTMDDHKLVRVTEVSNTTYGDNNQPIKRVDIRRVCLLPAGKKLVETFDQKSFVTKVVEGIPSKIGSLIMVALGVVITILVHPISQRPASPKRSTSWR